MCARTAGADAASEESRDLWRYLLRGALRAAANAPDAAAAGALGVARAAAKAAAAKAAGSDANARRDLSGAPLEATRRGGDGDDELASLDLIADALRRALGAASAPSEGGAPRTSGNSPRDGVGDEARDRRGRALGAASRSLLGGAGRLAEDVDERRRAAAARARDATRRAARAARRGRTDKRRVKLVWDPPAAKRD